MYYNLHFWKRALYVPSFLKESLVVCSQFPVNQHSCVCCSGMEIPLMIALQQVRALLMYCKEAEVLAELQDVCRRPSLIATSVSLHISDMSQAACADVLSIMYHGNNMKAQLLPSGTEFGGSATGACSQ